jgi:FtsP/CotA-like multicopper oxidase with cupredoxin domain
MSNRVSRREFLTAGATITGGALLGSALGCTSDALVAPPATLLPTAMRAGPDRDLLDPREFRSRGGVLRQRISIGSGPVNLVGSPRFAPITYDNLMPGPSLLVNAGDAVDLTFYNRIRIGQADRHPGYGRRPRPHDTVTNVHFHGLHITPMGSGDNMLVMTEAGESHRYHFQVPADHPAGLFWYHPHVHGLVTNQLGRGGYGLMYIDNAHTRAVAATYRRRLLAIQQVYLTDDLRTIVADDGEREDPVRALTLVNGEQMPILRMRPGERQVWAIANASTSAFYQLNFGTAFAVRVLAYDGLTRSGYAGGTGPVQIAPGKRVELEVLAPTQPMTGVLSVDPYFQGVDTWPGKPIATIAVSGARMADRGEVPLDPAGLPSLAAEPVAKRRTIIFDQDDAVAEGEFGRFRMYLQGVTPHPFDPETPEWVDSILGTVEEWTIVNDTVQEHPLHVHVNPLQVLSVTGAYNSGAPSPALTTGYHDTVVVPPHGSAVVRTRFTEFTGAPILMHCHILDHEDMGMMMWFAVVES